MVNFSTSQYVVQARRLDDDVAPNKSIEAQLGSNGREGGREGGRRISRDVEVGHAVKT